MKILISGSSGFIGSALVSDWLRQGHSVCRLVRSHALLNDETALWDPENDTIDLPKLEWMASDEGYRAVVNLSGQNLFKERWTTESKKRLWNSRIKSTWLLAKTIASLQIKPLVYLSASATGYYGDRGDEILSEESEPPMGGVSFLADLAREWEKMAVPAMDAGIRVVNLRFGIVLGTEGGMLKRIRIPFKIGLGAPLGEGTQYMSWVTINDTIRAVNHIIATESIGGPVNLASPNPVTNLDFTRIIGYHFKAPVFMHAPPFLLRLIFGEAADEILLAGQRVSPVKLHMNGFKFRHTKLEQSLRYLLGG